MKGNRNCLAATLDLAALAFPATLEFAMFIFVHYAADCLPLTGRGTRHAQLLLVLVSTDQCNQC